MLNKENFNIIEYTYYTVTKYYIKNESKYGLEDNKSTGAYAVGILLAFNIISLLTIILAISYSKTSMLESLLFPVVAIIILISVFLSIYHFKRKHQYIFEKYENDFLKKKRNIMVITYIIFSVVFMFIAVYIGRLNWM